MRVKKMGILLLVLLLVCTCGCEGGSKKQEFDLTGYEELSEIYYAKVDFEDGVPVIYMYCADDDPLKQWILFQSVDMACIDLKSGISTRDSFLGKEEEDFRFFCYHFDAVGESFVYDEREYAGMEDEEFMEKAPALIVEYGFQAPSYLPESEQAALEQNIQEKIIDVIGEEYMNRK